MSMADERFAIGEIAIAVAPPKANRNLEMNGSEVEIISPYEMQYTRSGDYMGYMVQTAVGRFSCRPEYLRKKRPPREPLGDWELIPWSRPTKEKTRV